MTATIEGAFVAACLAVLAVTGAALLAWLACARPRLGLYTLVALTPTQFIFVPVATFHVSPADIVVVACATGLCLRLASGSPDALAAVRRHVLLGVMIAAYLIGFVALGHFSRTLIRVPLAIVPSVLACELLRRREHFGYAISALLTAALIDAGYGVAFLASGQPLHPTRFSGMMGVNFSAILILTAAVMAFAVLARTREPVKLLLPAALAVLGLATLSKMGILAVAITGTFVLWFVAAPRNRRLVLTAAGLAVVLAFSQAGIRQRLLARAVPEPQLDGVSRTSSEVRFLILRATWAAFGEQPLLGIGYDGFQRYSTRDAEIRASTAGGGYVTHNMYVEILIEGGLLAFVPFLLHFLQHGRRFGAAVDAIRRRRDGVVAATCAGFVVVMLSAWAANVLLHYVFWSVTGLALACLVRLEDDSGMPPVTARSVR